MNGNNFFSITDSIRNPQYDPNSRTSNLYVSPTTQALLNPVDQRIEKAAGKTSLTDKLKQTAIGAGLNAVNPLYGTLYQGYNLVNPSKPATQGQVQQPYGTPTPTTQTNVPTGRGQTGQDAAPNTTGTVTAAGRSGSITTPTGGGSVPSYDPSITGQPVDPNRLSPDELKDLATKAGQAGLSLNDYVGLVNANAGMTSDERDDIRDELGIDDLADQVYEAPKEKLEDIYEKLYKDVGLGDLKTQIASLDADIQRKRDDFTKVEGEIKNNPWLSSASRRGRLKNAAELALADISNDLDARTQALDLYNLGVTEIETKLANIVSDRNLQRELDTNRLNYLLNEAERREEDITADRTIAGLRNVPDFISGARNEQLRLEAAEAAADAIGNGAVEIPVARINESGELVAGTEPPKAPNTTERSNFAFYQRMAEAVNNLEAVESEITDQGLIGQTQMKVFDTPLFLTSEQQRYEQAARQFTEARLRKDSGAAIPESEFENDRLTYFPQPGDDAQVLAQKKRARETTLNALRASSGNAYWEFYGVSPIEETVARIQGSGTATGGGTTATQADRDYASSLNLNANN